MNNIINTSEISIPYNYDTSEDSKRDRAYIIFLYSPLTRPLLKLVNDELDKLEYEGSIIFQEYPDRDTIQEIIQTIHNKFASTTNESNMPSILHLLEALFLSEMINRRRRYYNLTVNQNK